MGQASTDLAGLAAVDCGVGRWRQEEGNIPYVLDNNVGAFCKDPVKIAEIISDWFGPNRAELTAMAKVRSACQTARASQHRILNSKYTFNTRYSGNPSKNIRGICISS